MNGPRWMQASRLASPVFQRALGAERPEVVARRPCGSETKMGAHLAYGWRTTAAARAFMDEIQNTALLVGQGVVHGAKLPHA